MKTRRLFAAACALAMITSPTGLTAAGGSAQEAAPVKQSRARHSPVTHDGFDRHLYNASLYVEIPLVGSFGRDTYRESVIQTIRMAAVNPHIQHIVFTIDSDEDAGSLFETEVLGIHTDKLEFHGVIQDALFLATASVFFCDSLYVAEGARVGGLPLKQYFPDGSDEVLAKWVGIRTNQLASAAETRGHNPAIVRAMIDDTKSLHYWRQDGEVFVSNSPPIIAELVQNYEHITPVFEGETIALTHDQAIKLNLAQHIEEFDAAWVGDKLGAQHWISANRFGHVTTDLAEIADGLNPLAVEFKNLNNELPEISRDNNNDLGAQFLQDVKRNLDRAVEAIEQINQTVNDLYAVHPERHVYFAGDNGQTIVADPSAWASDARRAQQLTTRLHADLTTLRNTIAALDVVRLGLFPNFPLTPDFIDPYTDAAERIREHIEGIRRHGNAHYWDSIYQEPYPEDELFTTYG